jgi:hypothetical protein
MEYKVFLNVRPPDLQGLLDKWAPHGWRLSMHTGADHLLILERQQ